MTIILNYVVECMNLIEKRNKNHGNLNMWQINKFIYLQKNLYG